MKSLFIVGFWNSGTTLLVDILRKHPILKLKKARFKPNLEERTIRKILKKLGTDFFDFGDYSEVIANGFDNYEQPKFDETQREKFRKSFLWHFGVSKDKMLLLKNPWLFYFQDFIAENFVQDDMKKIVILRNGYSQVVSKDYWLRDKENPEGRLIARSVFWQKSMEHYFKTWHNDPDCLTIRYENLCGHPEQVTEQVCDFLGVPFQPLIKSLPAAFENRMTKWNQLEDRLKVQVSEHVEAMQAKIDEHFPLIKK